MGAGPPEHSSAGPDIPFEVEGGACSWQQALSLPVPAEESQETDWIHIPGAPASPAHDKEKAECVCGGGLPCNTAENPTQFPILLS